VQYRVLITTAAETDLDAAFEWIARSSPANAELVIDHLIASIRSLARLPRRFALAPENRSFPEEVRHVTIDSFRVIYAIEGRQVVVLRIRHAAQRALNDTDD
jgi:plasmid stabilization system protein ParE